MVSIDKVGLKASTLIASLALVIVISTASHLKRLVQGRACDWRTELYLVLMCLSERPQHDISVPQLLG